LLLKTDKIIGPMLILITTLLLFATALAVLILRIMRPEFRFSWLTAIGGTLLAAISVMIWQTQIPLSIEFPWWQSANLSLASISFSADGLSWPYAASLVILSLAILLTASVRENLADSLAWTVSLSFCGLGLLAVTANNPLTLALVWGALDLAELLIMLKSASGRKLSERAVIAFSVRAWGIVLLLIADVVGAAAGKAMDFQSVPPQAGLFLLAAAGLRLGVLPVHLQYASDSALRRDIGTTQRIVSAAASLILLSRVPAASLDSPLVYVFLIMSLIAGLYGGWMWLRAPDELRGRPYWTIALASLAVTSSLRGSPAGATAWGVALILGGGALFLASVQQTWLNRALLLGAWALSSLPFSLTATGWENNGSTPDFIVPLFLAAQAFIIAGFVRHALRPSMRPSLESQPAWTKSVYPAGIGLLLLFEFLLGFWGWDGALQIGVIWGGVTACLLTLGLLWAARRFPILSPGRAQWLESTSGSQLDRLYQNVWGFYRFLGRITQTISKLLDGESGIIWTLLFLIFFVLLLVQRKP
jgi:hypothetical protein